MAWISLTLKWYFAFLIPGIIFFPLSKKILGKYFPDQGYGFTKVFAMLFISYSAFVLGVLKILPFTQFGIFFLIFIFAAINYFIFALKNVQSEQTESPLKNHTLFLIVFEEILFLAALLYWAFVRGQEPSVRGLEKFMDFGFINSILKSKYFPPLDMWYSNDKTVPGNNYINYYYFGHLTGALYIKLTGIKSAIGYNLILASTFALSVVQSFSLAVGIIFQYKSAIKKFGNKLLEKVKFVFFGLLGSFIVCLGGNLHTIYVFTKGYPNESPIPFWKILSWYNPTRYWYPNATRFIPYTIHEFPSYSWVVADMHGHVFDIPFVLLTLAFLFIFFIGLRKNTGAVVSVAKKSIKSVMKIRFFNLNLKIETFSAPRKLLLAPVFLGFLTAVHYMTNAFDGPIYILLTLIIFYFLFRFSKSFWTHSALLIGSFILFTLPFSLHFKPFVSGIGVNCSPGFLVNLKQLGPFLFEKGNCQISPLWMLLVLWGFFWINFLILLFIKSKQTSADKQQSAIDRFFLILFSYGTFLLIIPEFFYIKDIYPQHFRANTMFKLGYQAFIMMGIASTYTFFRIKFTDKLFHRILLSAIFVFFFFFVAIYPLYSIPSYYGQLDRPVELDGSKWFKDYFPEDIEIIDYLNNNVPGQPTVLEAQGDSYTDYDRVSAYTGFPTVAGWWVHEWLWRGTADVVGSRIPDIVNIYESDDIALTKSLLQKYNVSYIVVSKMEKQKYTKLKKDKFSKIATLIFQSSNGEGALYQVKN